VRLLLEEHGVRLDAAMRRNYGDPAGEYAAAREASVVDRATALHPRARPRPRPHGPGAGLQRRRPRGRERAVYATVLTPKGRMVADVRLLRRGDELLLETDAAAAEPLAAHLRKYVPPLFARFEDASPRGP
jgi:hypothetical protein